MPQFDYTVLDLHGRNRHGVISADSVHGARALLEQRQWVPVRLEVAAAGGGPPRPPPPRARPGGGGGGPPPGPPRG
ncbi:hypothetical protein Q6A19_21090, partial [Xanthomonas euvesicatoria pv. eucalypti]|nr:hypothetical protein [Xanthomonas euvesicatoria pv. eucalypti]